MRVEATRMLKSIFFKAAWSVVGLIAVLFLTKSFQKKSGVKASLAAKNAAHHSLAH